MFESLNEIILSAIILIAGGIICVPVAKWLKVRPVPAILLYLWHSMFAAFYANYVLQNGGDAFVYYQRARFDFVEAGFGTDFIVWLTSGPTSLGLTYWPIALLYNFIGALGLLFFYAALRQVLAPAIEAPFAKALLVVCAFLPSFSFWTSGIGKDSVAGLSVGLFLWSTVSFARRQPAAISAIVIMLWIRPHIAALMVVSVALGTMFASELRASVRFGAGTLAAGAAIFAVPMALVYSGSTRFTSIAEYVGDRQEQNLGGGSSIDLVGMNPVLRFFSFLFRPLPNEATSVEQLVTSLDNLLLIALAAMGCLWIYRVGVARVFRQHSIVLIYSLSCATLLSQVTANLGLASRQKWMVMPALLFIFASAWSTARAELADRRRLRRPMAAMVQARR